MTTNQFDGLIIVHPNFGIPINPNYKANLGRITQEFFKRNKAVFLEESEAKPMTCKKMKKDLAKAFHLRRYLHPDSLVSLEMEISYIEKTIGKPRENIILAFGGTNAGMCVYACAIDLCRYVETKYINPIRETIYNISKIKKGVVLDEIV
ncbi:hypothetical protein J4474_03015 [Candidatus Pacearchaeota archaeon]|nr:hypothetical protein [Candidatus Pacearchaeota archaeon]